jgi:hypothetical protein
MTSEGLGEMFESDSADTCAGKLGLVNMGGRAEGLACADPGDGKLLKLPPLTPQIYDSAGGRGGPRLFFAGPVRYIVQDLSLIWIGLCVCVCVCLWLYDYWPSTKMPPCDWLQYFHSACILKTGKS